MGHSALLRQLHAWLIENDPSFGGLVRVQNKRQEFLWVHQQFEQEYLSHLQAKQSIIATDATETYDL